MKFRCASSTECAFFSPLKYGGTHILILYAFFIWAGLATAQASPEGRAHVSLPADLTGTHNGVVYAIRVPANWNGTLLVYAHAGLTETLEIAPQPFVQTTPTLEERLLTRGYALAGSYYPSDGNSEKEATRLTLALTDFFNGMVGKPLRTIVWGVSTGGTAALELVESHPAIYDGAIAVAPAAAGRGGDADFTLQYGLAYAAAFGWPDEFWGPVENLRDDLWGNEGTLIEPVFQWPAEDGSNFGQWEFVRLLMQLPERTWWDFDGSVGLWGFALEGWKATAYRSLLEQVCSGPVAQNIGAHYTLTTEEKDYLAALDVDADPLLAWMNAHANIAARRSARQCVERDGTPSGKLSRPALTMHGMYDDILPVSNEAAYRALVDAAQRSDFLVQTYVDTVGHMTFTVEQYLATLDAMEHWLDTGVRPDAAFFPEDAGFNNTFVPPPWPY